MKKILSVITILFSASVFFADESESKPELNVALLNGPSSIPAAYLIENKDSFTEATLNFQIFSGADMELPKLLKGEVDLAVLPPNAAAKVYNMTKGAIAALAVTGNTNISLLTTRTDYVDFSSLKGKTVYCAGRGATPEYLFIDQLEKAGLSAGDSPLSVNLDFSIPNAELAGAIITGKAEYILVPEPFSTVALTKSTKVKKACQLPADLPMTLIVANKKNLMAKRQIIDAWLAEYAKAVEWTKSNPQKAGKLVQKHTLGLNEAIAAKSIPGANYVYISAKDGKKDIEKLLTLFAAIRPESIGDRLPDDSFYQK